MENVHNWREFAIGDHIISKPLLIWSKKPYRIGNQTIVYHSLKGWSWNKCWFSCNLISLQFRTCSLSVLQFRISLYIQNSLVLPMNKNYSFIRWSLGFKPFLFKDYYCKEEEVQVWSDFDNYFYIILFLYGVRSGFCI